MKRSLASLLDYDNSDEDDTTAEETVRPQRKRYELIVRQRNTGDF